jgi:hypothetical protein
MENAENSIAEKSYDTIGKTALRFFLYALGMGALGMCLTLEVRYFPRDLQFSEHSLIEPLQEIILFIAALTGFAAARADRSRKAVGLILGGAALCAFIREMDFFFDAYVFDGMWQTLVTVVLLVTGYKVYQLRSTLGSVLTDFINRPCFGIIVSGFMSVFIYSRIFGRGALWHAIMGEQFIRVAKNAAEEGSELAGYYLIYVGVLEYLLFILRQRKRK